MIQFVIYPLGLCISAFLLISVTTRKKRTIQTKLLLVVAADLIATASILFQPFHVPGTYTIPALSILLINVIALNKIFSPESPQQEIYNAWHDDPANWRLGVFYYNPKDYRIFPPKKMEGFGWTINFANPYSVSVFVIMLAFIALICYVSTRINS